MRCHRLLKLVALAATVTCYGPVHAYLSPSAPPGFTGNPGSWMFKPPTATQVLNGIAKGPGPSINLGGAGTVTRGVGYSVATNAGRFLARGAILNPLLLGVGLAAWFAEECISYSGGQWQMTCVEDEEISVGKEYRVVTGPWRLTRAWACNDYIDQANAAGPTDYYHRVYVGVITSSDPLLAGDCQYRLKVRTTGVLEGGVNLWNIEQRDGACPAGWKITPGGLCTQTSQPKILTPEEVEEAMEPVPLPLEIPANVPIPITFPPIWNPDPAPAPGTKPVSVPVIAPLGEPVAVPNSDPQAWEQPAVRLRHAPTTDNPWRMANEPVNVPVAGPGGGLPGAVDQPEPGTETPGEQPPALGLCDQYPDILACQKMGMIEAEPVKDTEVPLEITPEEGFGSGGQCPAPKQVGIQGKNFTFSMQPICDMAVMVKPLFLGFAWLSAAMIFLGIARKEG